VMEDGVVRDTKAGLGEYEALTAIHIDTNLPEQVMVGASNAPEGRSILPPQDALSRFDYITNIPALKDELFEVGHRMVASLAEGRDSRKDDSAKRALKVLVALLRERQPSVRVPNAAVQALLRMAS